MARPREFDMDEALDAAMSTFWTQGYEATSMADLTKATGLHKGSIYKAFEDKHDLFMKSLGRYLDGAYERMRATLSQPGSPLDNLRSWMHGVVAMCSEQPVQRGCLAMNTACELGAHDEAVARALRSHHGRATLLLIATIERGQQAGQIRSDLPAERLAQSLFIFGAGLLGTSKVLGDMVDAAETVESALTLVLPT
jgi:TetR/AcrR family transcriptional repressor of nem operon